MTKSSHAPGVVKPPDELWARRYAAAKAVWPRLRVGPLEFRAFVEERWPEGVNDRAIAFADLLLTCGCALHRSDAIAAFERAYRNEIEGVVKRLGHLAPPLEDALQLVRERLFMGAPPRIAMFRGKGSLKSWVRVVTLRTLLNYHHANRYNLLGEGDKVVDFLLADTPELRLMKEQYAAEVRAVLRDSIADLTTKERALLKMAFVDGTTVDAIGAFYDVHRATAARWVQTAHRALARRVHQHLRQRLRLRADELESALRFIASAFDTSLTRYLE